MTVSSTARKQVFAGGQGTLDFTFRALASAPTDIKVKKTLISTGVDTDLTYTTEYTAVIATDGVGGTVTISPTIGTTYNLTVYRETTNKQESDYDDYNQFPANTLETDLDRRTLVDQEQTEELGRSIKLPISSTLTGLLLPNPVAGKALKWNTAQTALVNTDVDIDTAIAAALASQNAAATSAATALTAQTASETARESSRAAATTSTTQATNASTSATTASSHATSALGFSLNASTSATSALAYRNTAGTYATNALNSEYAAGTYATLALSYKNAAGTSATSALASQLAASTSATLALGYSNTASTHATTATIQAGIATTQATIATSQATTILNIVAAGGIVKGDGTVNPTNLLSNGDFENWSAGASAAPDGWTLSAGSIAREASIIKQGTYSAKITRSGSDLVLYVNNPSTKGIEYFKGRTVTLSCWVYATVANRARIAIYDTGYTYSSYHTGDSTWQLLKVTVNMSNSSALLQVALVVDTGDTSAYFDGAMCVEGESAFAFSDKPAGEGVITDYGTVSTIVGWSSFTEKHILVSKIGKLVFINFDLEGTSDNTATSFTLPYPINATMTHKYIPMALTYNNSIAEVVGTIDLETASQTATLSRTLNNATWTALGNKICTGQFFYETT